MGLPKSHVAVAVLLTCAAIVSVGAINCQVQGPNGVIDFSTYSPQIYQLDQDHNHQSYPFLWLVSLCAPVASPGNLEPCSGGDGYVAQYSAGGSGHCSASWTSASEPTYDGTKVQFSYQTSDAWIMNIGVGCGQSSQLDALPGSKVMVTGDSAPYTFSMSLTTQAVCGGGPPPPTPPTPSPFGPPPTPSPFGPPPTPAPFGPQPTPNPNGAPPPKKKGGLTGGGIFVIIFFVTLVVYVAGTMTFNYVKQGKRGRELAPHPEFWTSIPGLVKDGCVFVFQKLRGLCNKTRGASDGYQEV